MDTECTKYTPHGYLLGRLMREYHALDVYEAVRAHDSHPVHIYRIKRDKLKTMELVDMELNTTSSICYQSIHY